MLPNLQGFYASSNQFTGSIPASLSNTSNLEDVQLLLNNLQGEVPSLHKLRRLRKILLGENFLGIGQTTDLNFVYSLPNSTKLQVFDIFQNNFKGVIPPVMCNFSMLTALSIGRNKLSGPIPTCIRSLVDLVEVDATECQLSGSIPVSIGELKKLYRLLLSYNKLSGHLPTSIGNLTQLGSLDLGVNNLQGQIPSIIGNCKSLQSLNLSYNNLRGRIPWQVFTLPTLSISLDLSHNQLTGPLPVEVGTLTQLDALYISQNKLTGEIPITLGACKSLEVLVLAGKIFQGNIPSTLNALAGLQELNLSDNSLSGKIPDFLATFKLQKLDLLDNNFEGEVPSIGIFSNATGVLVSGNSRLCGGVPELRLPQCNFNKTRKRRLNHKMRLMIAIVSVISGVIPLVAFASLLYSFYCRKRRIELESLDGQDPGNTLSNLSYQALLKATNGFTSQNLIGSGTFGDVYKGNFDESRIVAIKKFNLEHKDSYKSFMVECIDYQGNDFRALVYEYMVNGSLEDWLHSQPSSSAEGTSHALKKLNLTKRLDVAVDVAFAFEYLHHGYGDPIVHCDLKPSNVLLDDEMVAHVSDFGLAKFLLRGICSSHANQSSSIGVRGTIGYAPPEYSMGNEVSKHGDIYSFGILLLEMFTGKRPTDNMFKESLSIHNFVKASLPEQVLEILDNALIKDIVGDETITLDTNREAQSSKIVLEALTSVLEIALCCSAELPQERLDMKYVASKLSSIRNKLAGTVLRQQR